MARSIQSDPVNYKVVNPNANTIEVKTFSNDEQVTYTAYFSGSDLYYIYAELDGFKWKEYIRRKH